MNDERLQLAKVVFRLKVQLLHGSGEAKSLLLRDRKHREVECLTESRVGMTTLEHLVWEMGSDTIR
jgi:hypothetical protein